MRKSSGVTIVEVVIASLVAIPLFLVAWNALVTGRMAEDATAWSAAARGSQIFERYLRADLACLDPSMGASACTTSDGRLDFACALPATAAGAPMVRKEVRTYTFDPAGGGALEVKRNGVTLQGVLLGSVNATVVGSDVERWVQVELVAYDPGLKKTRAGDLVAHAATILVPIPAPFNPDFLVDYTVHPPREPQL